jgi:catechol 2,3-dioxygenase-like lactoylglutathione lyase family enzyme
MMAGLMGNLNRRRFACAARIRHAARRFRWLETRTMTAERATIESLSAVTFFTTDMARSCAFYAALGFEALYGGADASFTSYRAGAGYLNVAVGTPPERLWGRAILHVSDVDAMYRRALDAGLSPEMAPSDAPWGERYFHLRDPDGNELSFARPLAR